MRTFKSLQDFSKCFLSCDVSSDMEDVVDGSGILQINRHYSFSLNLVIGSEKSFLPQLFPAYLAPAAGCTTEIDHPLDSFENVIDLLDLQ